MAKMDLTRQNQILLDKIHNLSEALDEEQEKCESFAIKLSTIHENIEINERKQHINEILNTNQSFAEYLRDNLETIQEEYPSYFCKCLGKYEENLLKHRALLEKYKNLQENCVALECNNQNLSNNITHLLKKLIELINIKESKRSKNIITLEEKFNNSHPLQKKRNQYFSYLH